ncbi:Pleckstrin domain-containing family A member 8, partial [Blattella germanica]
SGEFLSNEDEIFFNSVQLSFPEVIDGQINTWQFLESSKGVVRLIEKFGKVFSAIKYDLTGNIEKINQKYDTDREKYAYLNEIIRTSKEEGVEGEYAVDEVLWLRRNLQFIHTFLNSIIQDSQNELKSEDLVPFLKKAYKNTIEKHQGWMAQHMFGLLSRMCPTRKEFMQTLALGKENKEETVLRDMAVFLKTLESNIQLLSKLCLENNLGK